MTSLENILFYYNRLEEKNSNKDVLRHMLPCLPRIGTMGIQELADACYTSPSTISRIVKTLGYNDYRDFRSSVDTCVQQYEFHNRFCEDRPDREDEILPIISRQINRVSREFKKRVLLQELEPIVEAMHRAESVTIYGYGIFYMENVLQSDLIMSGKQCDIVCGDQAQLEHARKQSAQDIGLFLWPEAISGTVPMRMTLQAAQKSGSKICLLSSTERPSSFCKADYTITYPGTMHMVDTVYLELILTAIDMLYRDRYLDHAEQKTFP